MKQKIVITLPTYGKKLDDFFLKINQMGFDIEWKCLNNTNNIKEIVSAVRGYEIAFVGGELWNKEVIESVKDSLKMIVRFGAGVEKIDIDTATKNGIIVTNTPGKNSKTVAEHTLSLMFALGRNIVNYDNNMKKGIWQPILSKGIFGKKIGLIGFGAVSKELTKILHMLNCKVYAYDLINDEKFANEYGVEYVEVENLLKVCDYVSLHTPLNETTIGMVNYNFLSKMKKTAYLINASRGKIVVEKDLIKALKENLIAGAALDVFEEQPLRQDSLLKNLNNVILTPHVAWLTDYGYGSMFQGAIENLIDYSSKKVPRFILNPNVRV